MPITSDYQSLAHDAEIELFSIVGYNSLSPNETFYFCNHLGVSFNKIPYLPIECAIEGIQYTGEGSLPRPKLTVSDTKKILSSLMYFYGGIEGSKFTIQRTVKRYLDGQPYADATAIKFSDSFKISQCVQEIPGVLLEFEMAAAIDFVDESAPSRPALPLCPWIYRGAECGYSRNQGWTIDNRKTNDPKKDVCAKTVTACAKHFGQNAVLPHGGFPGLRRLS